jgi:hypothetical protein
VKAQGGDTLFIPAMSGLTPPPASPAGPSYGSSVASPYGAPPSYGQPYASPMAAPYAQPIASAPPKKKRRGLLLFLIALVVVILLSAAAGFGLRAYQRGELTSPSPPAG